MAAAGSDRGGEALRGRLERLAALRAAWRPPADEADRRRRGAYAAWCNAGIEGNPLSWPRAWRLLAGPEPARLERPERELLGCRRAQEFLAGAGADWEWTPRALRHLHGLLMDGLAAEAGDWRRREVRIVRETGPGAGRPVFTPPHPLRVPELMETLLARARADLVAGGDPFLAAGRFHYEFQSVHPFADGNGRLGRLLTTRLARAGWHGDGFHLEPAVRRAGAGYYLALRAVRPDYESEPAAGLLPWLAPFLDMAADALARPEAPAPPIPDSGTGPTTEDPS